MYIRVSNTKQEIVVYLAALIVVLAMMVGLYVPTNNTGDTKQVSNQIRNEIITKDDGNTGIITWNDDLKIIQLRHSTNENHWYDAYIYRCQVNIGIR